MVGRKIVLDTAVIQNAEELVIQIRQSRLPEWALEITLLIESLSSALTVQAPDGFRLALTLLSAGTTAPKRSRLVRRGSKAIDVDVPRNQMEFLQAVLLRAYRDESAEVNHVHLEGELGGRQFDLTWLFDTARPPMSADEASRLMDDD